MIRSRLIALVGALAFAALTTAGARAATFTVTVTIDDDDALPGNGVCETTPGGGVCTLRAAIQEANALAGEDLILLPADTIMLTRAGSDDTALNGDLDIIGRLTVRGVTSGTSIVDANDAVTNDRVFHVQPGAVVTMSHVLVRRGRAVGSSGGGIATHGALTLSDCRVEDNYAPGHGGGLLAAATGGPLVIARCDFRDNWAGDSGGGLYAGGLVTITDSLFDNNEADADGDGNGNGGGIELVNEQALLRSVTIQRNRAIYGGGVAVDDTAIEASAILSNTASADGGGLTGAKYRLADSRVAGNTAGWRGGGISSQVGCLPSCPHAPIMERSVIAHNQAVTNGGGISMRGVTLSLVDSAIHANSAASGGGINSDGAAGAIVNSTISGNTATGSGGGLYVAGSSCGIAVPPCALRLLNATVSSNVADSNANGTGAGGGVFVAASTLVTVANTLIANNINDDPDTVCGAHCVIDEFHEQDCFGTLRSLDYNLIEFPVSGECTLSGSVANTLIGVDPKLKALGNYGGQTSTHLPQRDSPALNKGNPAGCKDANGVNLARDQRSALRPKAGRCDIGAVEGADVIRALLPSSRRGAAAAW